MKHQRNRQDTLLWASILTPPIAWFVDQQVSYAWVTSACAERGMLPIHVTFFITLMLALVGTAIGYRELRNTDESLGGVEDVRDLSRARFMALCGTGGGLFFVLLIIATEIPNLIHHPCDS
jgi:hypothetical protein